MRLAQLLHGIETVSVADEQEITHLTLDSRTAQPGSAFIAITGTKHDGNQFIADALARGAIAVLIDTEVAWTLSAKTSVTIVKIANLKQQIGAIAANFYHHPAQKLQMIGVTGTNGKTSCAHFIAQLFSELNLHCGLIGSLGRGFYGKLIESEINTPDAISLQATLADFVAKGAKYAVMEVSSHGIDQARIAAVPFAVAIFTNLSQDHLDYHGSMENYAAVKLRFLASPAVKRVVINVDDDYGKVWATQLAAEKPTYCYSLAAQSNTEKNIFATDFQTSLSGFNAHIHTPVGESDIQVPLIGHFNLSNVLAACMALHILDIAMPEVLAKLSQLHSVPGRMQILKNQQFPLIVVDHSHSPDSLAKALQVLAQHKKGKLICVFGCGGDRDRSKRPKMAKIVEQYADLAIVTSDNPRSEDPNAIIQEILPGFDDLTRVVIEVDRSKAIEKSIQLATINDCILIAGKGAERYQQFADKKIPFNDAEKVLSHFKVDNINNPLLSSQDMSAATTTK